MASIVTELVRTSTAAPHKVKKGNIYCGPGWKTFGNGYNEVDDPVLVTLCILGILFNLWNLLIFIRKRTKSSSLDLILGTLAVADLLFCLRKVVDLTLRGVRKYYGSKRSSYQREFESIMQDFFTNLFHTWSIYLTMLAGFWYVWNLYKNSGKARLVSKNGEGQLNLRRMKIILFVTIFFSTAMVIFMFSPTRITEIERRTLVHGNSSNAPTTFVKLKKANPKYMRTRSPVGTLIFYCIYGFLIKLGPCLIVTILLLILCYYACKGKTYSESDDAGIFEADQVTTRIMLALLFLFTTTEFFVGVFKIIVAFPGVSTFDYTYECLWPMINFLNMNEYISSVTTFICYVTLSISFRKEFLSMSKKVLRKCGCYRKRHSKSKEVNLYSSASVSSMMENYQPSFIGSGARSSETHM